MNMIFGLQFGHYFMHITLNVQDAAKTSGHSKLLTDKETVYQIVSDTVAPRDWEDYVKHKGQLMQRANDTEGIRWEHCASWHFRYGDVVFRAMHLIKFDGVSCDKYFCLAQLPIL